MKAFNNWKCTICGNVFKTRREMQEHRKQHEKTQNHFCVCYCKFCGRKSTSKEGNTLHEKSCLENPNRVSGSNFGKHISDETREKLKKNAGGYRKNAGHGKRGYYKGLYCMSSWELAWVVYQLEHGKNVLQCTEKFPYKMNGVKHNYTPDFIIDNVYYEIKNWHRPDTKYKVDSFPKDKTLVLIEGKKAMEKYIKYTEEKYGKDFCKLLYEA